MQVCLQKTGVPYDSPLEGQSPWDFALITPGKARRCLFYFILFFCHNIITGQRNEVMSMDDLGHSSRLLNSSNRGSVYQSSKNLAAYVDGRAVILYDRPGLQVRAWLHYSQPTSLTSPVKAQLYSPQAVAFSPNCAWVAVFWVYNFKDPVLGVYDAHTGHLRSSASGNYSHGTTRTRALLQWSPTS